jgi:molecular chaperone GrpE
MKESKKKETHEEVEEQSVEQTATKPEMNEIEVLRQEVEEQKRNHLRAVADYRNLEQRMFKERSEISQKVKADVISSFFPVLDNLNKAEMFIKDPGLKMIMDQFKQVFEQNGVQEVELLGKEFDPHTAECIEVVDGDTENTVVEVVRKAYSLNGKVIQHGQVKVSKQK